MRPRSAFILVCALGIGVVVVFRGDAAKSQESALASLREVPTNVLLFGEHEPPSPPIRLHAGPLTMVFEPDTVFLRYLQFGEEEILRGVYAAVRDQHWGTVTPQISQLEINQSAAAFELTFQVRCHEDPIDFAWQGRIIGQEDGTVTFSMDGKAQSTFLRNRIGFCVLHPIEECTGQPCLVEKVDGTREDGEFPGFISPHQPFKDMRAISHQVAPGLTARVEFAGDVFEMEDQRNWTDASYKTYCTPLSRPLPVKVQTGDEVRQSVRLTLHSNVRRPAPPDKQPRVRFAAIKNAKVPLPLIGLGLAGHDRPLSEKARGRLTELVQPDHIRAEVHLSDARWSEQLKRAQVRAEQLQSGLELVLFLGDAYEAQLNELAQVLTQARPALVRCLVLEEGQPVTSGTVLVAAHEKLKEYRADVVVGTGTNQFFTELNRNRPALDQADFVAFSVNPQVHAFDNLSIVESFVGQQHAVLSARQFCGTVPIVVSPVTWKIRATPEAIEATADTLPSTVDTRQMSLFGAGFTLGTLKYLAEAEVRSVTFYATTGLHGIMETESASPWTQQFPAPPNSVYPVYHFLTDVREFDGGHVVPSLSSQPLAFEGLILEKQNRRRLCLANLTGEAIMITCDGVSADAHMRVMDETNVRDAMVQPEAFRQLSSARLTPDRDSLTLELKPFAYAIIDMTAPRD